MLALIILCSYTMLIGNVNAAPDLSLTSSLPSNGSICPGPIQFNCTGTEVGGGLAWRVNGTDHVTYAFVHDHSFPRTVNLNPHLMGVEVIIVSASLSQNSQVTIDIVSTLSSNVSILSGSMIQCLSGVITSEVLNVTEIGVPPQPSFTSCSILRTNVTVVSIQWSPSFTSQYNVEMYHVVVNPATPSCPSDQMIGPSKDYSCSGLILGTHYSFNVSAINCENQEGPESTITVHPQAPRTPEVRVSPLYDQNGQLNLTVQWIQQIQSPSENCSFNQLLSYTVVLEDSTRERVDQRMINSDNCSDNNCSISFILSSPDQNNYFIDINITGVFGLNSTSLNTTIPSSFNVTASSEGCVTSVLCSYPMREGDCFFQYGHDSSYQDLSPSLSTSLNSPLQITVPDAATIHYYQVTIDTSSLNFLVRGNFTSGEGAQLTSASQGLLVVGVILLSVAVVLGVIITWMVFKKGPWLSLSLSMTGFVVTFVSLVLWVAVGFHVGLQKNTCDLTWQSSRDGLTISAHVFSDISLLIFVAAGIYSAVDYISLPNYKKRSSEQMSFWQKCLHRSNRYQPREKGWPHKKLEELEVSAGGRVKELEELNAQGFRKPGQSYIEAKLELQEGCYQEYKNELPTDGSKGEEPASKGKGEYRPGDHGKGVGGHGHKDKSSSTQEKDQKLEHDARGSVKKSEDPVAEEFRKSGQSDIKLEAQERMYDDKLPTDGSASKGKGEDSHYCPLDHGKGGGHKDKPARGDHKKGSKGAGSKDKPSSTQGGSGEEYSALGNSKESDRTPAKPSASQAHKEEGKHCLPLNHGKGDRSGRKDKPSSTQKGSGGEYSALELKVGPGGRVKEKEDLNADEFRKPGQSYMEAKLEHQERLYQDYKDELPTDGSKEPVSKGKGEDSHYRPLDHGKGRGHKDNPARETRGGEEYSALNSGRASGGPSTSQVHRDGEKDQHYLPLDHKKGGKGIGSKNKPSSTQGGSGEEYSALGNGKESGRKPAKPSPSQAHKEEGEHYLPLDHEKGDKSGRKDKPSSTQKGSGGEYSALGI